MTKLSITHEFVRKLTKEIRAAYGTEVRHTQILAIIAKSLGWQPDALMHMLKNRTETIENNDVANRRSETYNVGLVPHAAHGQPDETDTVGPVTESNLNNPDSPSDPNEMRSAMTDAMRRNPDVIVIGECTDPETIRLVREARELGHVIWSTLQNRSLQT